MNIKSNLDNKIIFIVSVIFQNIKFKQVLIIVKVHLSYIGTLTSFDTFSRFQLILTLSYTAIIGIASFTAVAENGQCKNNGI